MDPTTFLKTEYCPFWSGLRHILCNSSSVRMSWGSMPVQSGHFSFGVAQDALDLFDVVSRRVQFGARSLETRSQLLRARLAYRDHLQCPAVFGLASLHLAPGVPKSLRTFRVLRNGFRL